MIIKGRRILCKMDTNAKFTAMMITLITLLLKIYNKKNLIVIFYMSIYSEEIDYQQGNYEKSIKRSVHTVIELILLPALPITRPQYALGTTICMINVLQRRRGKCKNHINTPSSNLESRTGKIIAARLRRYVRIAVYMNSLLCFA